MSTFTKEQLIEKLQHRISVASGFPESEKAQIDLEVARIALASLEAEPVGTFRNGPCGYSPSFHEDAVPLYTTPPAPVSVPEWTNEQCLEFLSIAFRHAEIKGDLELDDIRLGVKMVNGSRAAMLQGADGNSPVIQDGWVMVPVALTAENGAKACLLGEFSESTSISCPECFGDDECETCDGSGTIKIKLPVSWTTIKAIWARGVEHFAAAPQQEVK